MKAYITIDQERCKSCSLCIEFCPKNAIYITEKLNLKGYYVAGFKQDSEAECTGCATCAIMCPDVAIEVYKS